MREAICAVVVAGGKSSRMGQDKSLLPFGDCDTLAEHQYRKLKRHFSDVRVSSKTAKFPFDAPLILDESEAFSVMRTLGTLLRKCMKPLFVLAVDTPFVSDETIEALCALYEEKTISVVARSDSGLHPLCALYTPKIVTEIETLIAHKEERLHALLARIDTIAFDVNEQEMRNLNTPEAYEEALKHYH